jgi:hypothetical protein
MSSIKRQIFGFLAAAALAGIMAIPASAESPEAFAERVGKTQGVSAVVNLREDKSLGAIAIAILPELLANKAAAEPALREIGRFAAAGGFRATVVTPTQADNDFVAATLKGSGVARISTQVMADMVSIKTSRIFLSPAP